MKKVNGSQETAIVICPPWDINMPSLGVGYLCAFLKSRGIFTKVFDLNIELYHKSHDKKKWDMTSLYCWEQESSIQDTLKENENYIEEFIKRLLPFKVICFSVNVANLVFTIEMIKKIRESNKGALICAGGPITDQEIPAKLSECIDFLVVGEGESKLASLIKDIYNNKTIKVKNIKKTSEAIATSPSLNIDSIPWPTYEEFNLASYLKRELPLSGSRGCYGKCNFCTDWKRRPYTSRKADSIYEEVSYHVKKNKIRRFRFNDLIINGNVTQLEKFCDMVIKNKLNILWWSTAVINIGVTKELYVKMKKAGCYYLEYGIESFSPAVLRLMNKPFRYEHILPVLRNTYDARIRTGVNLLVGYPGETSEMFNENCSNLRKHYKYIERIANLNCVYLYGNSNINQDKKKYNIVYSGQEGYLKWHTSDMKNTYEIRIKRLAEIISLLRELRIPFPETHIKPVRDDVCAISGNNVFKNSFQINDYNGNIYENISPVELFMDSWKINGLASTLGYCFRYVKNKRFVRFFSKKIKQKKVTPLLHSLL